MRKLFVIAIIIFTASCNSSSKNSTSSDSSVNVNGVQNVNGNIPDTTNSIPINGSKKDKLQVDSSYVDSTKKK